MFTKKIPNFVKACLKSQVFPLRAKKTLNLLKGDKKYYGLKSVIRASFHNSEFWHFSFLKSGIKANIFWVTDLLY